jgi:hypothetical protein
MSRSGLLSRLLGREADEDDSGGYYSGEEIETRRSRRSSSRSSRGGADEEEPPLRDLITERVAETIADLPAGVPQESALLIVRRTLAAAGVKLSELDMSTRGQESKLSSEIELARSRQVEVREKTQEEVSSLEEEIRKAKEDCENVVSYEERKISHASATLEGVRRVRAFFELPKTEGEGSTGPDEQGTQQVRGAFDVERAQISDTPPYPGGSS